MPITRSRGNPVTCLVTQHITSSGLETTRTIASGQWRLISSETCFTMSALVRTRSSRLIPGLRAMPAVTTTRSLPAAGPQSFAPTTRVSKPSMGADSHWSSPLPWGTPSITSTRTTRRASSFSARRCAAVAPTLPAPTTVIVFIMRAKARGSFPLSTTWRGGQGVSSPAPGVHLPMGIGAQRVDLVERAAIGHAESLFGPAIGATLPRGPDERRQLLVRGATAQRGAQIDSLPRVETQEPRSVRRHAAAVAGAAERRGDRGDDPEGGAVRQAEPLGGRAPVTGDRRDRAVAPCQRREHVALRHDLVHGPVGGPAHVHVLDEPQLGPLGAAELEQLPQLVVVEAADYDAVELHLLEAGDARRADAVEHLAVPRTLGERQHPLGAERVEAHGDALQARRAQRRRLLREQQAVRGQRQIFDLRNPCDQAHQRREVVAQQRLATRQAHLAHAQPREHPHQAV